MFAQRTYFYVLILKINLIFDLKAHGKQQPVSHLSTTYSFSLHETSRQVRIQGALGQQKLPPEMCQNLKFYPLLKQKLPNFRRAYGANGRKLHLNEL